MAMNLNPMVAILNILFYPTNNLQFKDQFLIIYNDKSRKFPNVTSWNLGI